MRIPVAVLFLLACTHVAAIAQEPPRVVKMDPENRAVNVNPKLKEIVITFSEPMADKSWSVTGGGEKFLDIKSIFYRKNCTELVIKVKLKKAWNYRFGLNSVSFKNFKSRKGVPLVPMTVRFSTKGAKVESEGPYIVKMVPENGAANVDPRLKEIVVTFSEPMTDKSWSVTGGGDNFPKIESIFYRKSCTELVMKVALQPGWRYEFGINSMSHKNFKSRKGVPVEPVWVTFSTKGERGVAKKAKLESLGKIDFTLTDANGIMLRSQDYKGVPIFIAFGAAW